MFKILILLSIFSHSAANGYSFKEKQPECLTKNVLLETKRTEKDRRFLFWKLNHKKIIIVDKLIDYNGKNVLKKTSIFICSRDACDTRKSRIMKIVENEIWIFHCNNNPEKGKIKRYDFCGKYLGKKKWDNNKSIEDY